MKISAHIQNSLYNHQVSLATDTNHHSLSIAPKPGGYGSSLNGGELLFLALATCYCNDVYREAAKRGLRIERLEIDVEGDFNGEGQPATNVTYRARAAAQASDEEILDLLRHTDQVAEIQNTLRMDTPVTLTSAEVLQS